MPEITPDELENILREQSELRRRLTALDRRIESLAFQGSVPVVEAALPKVAERLPEVVEPPPVPKQAAPEPVFAEPVSPPSKPPLPTKASWEFQLGTVWFVRIGIVILLTGLVFLGNYAYHHIVPFIGPWVKLALLFTLGGGLAWLGTRLEKSGESLRNYGRVLLAGGVALIYYTTYGASFVEKLRVIDSPLLGGLLLLGVGGFVVWLAEKRQEQSVALLAILLSYYTSAINPLGLFSLYSSLLLTVAAVYFLLRHRWTTISFLSLAGTYGSYAFWRFYRSGGVLSFGEQTHVWQGIAFLACYWILFTVAVFLSRSTGFSPEKRTPFLTLNNAAFFGLVFQILHANFPDLTGRFALSFGAVLLLLAWVAKRRQTEDLFLDGAYLIQGLSVLTFGILTELNGYQLTLALTLQGTMMLFCANRRHGRIYEIGAFLVTLLAFGIGLKNRDWLTTGQATGWALSALLIADAWLSRNFIKSRSAAFLNGAAVLYCLLAITKLSLLIPVHFPPVSSELIAAITLIGLGTAIRLPELAITSQIFVFTAVVPYIFGADAHRTGVFTLVGIIFIPLLLVHWWQRQKQRDVSHLGQALFSLLFFGASARWLSDHFPDSERGVYLGLLAVAGLLYGIGTRTQILALLGQIFVFFAAGGFFIETFFHHPTRLWPALHILVVALDLVLIHLVSGRFSTRARLFVRVLLTLLQATLFLMLATWGWSYVDEAYRMIYFVVLASLPFFLAVHFQNSHPQRTWPLLGYAGAFATLGFLVFWNGLIQGQPASWWNVGALLLFALDERVGSKRLNVEVFPAAARAIMVAMVISGFFFEIDRWIDLSHSALPKTLAWALLGTVSLCLGLSIRNRVYRIGGLILLACATLRIFINDIWGLDPIFRILSFIVLGVVLLGLGFIYNKFADKLKEWL